MTKVAVATTSDIAADAARIVNEQGGNAVDCALAAAMMAINTEPGVCALLGSAYITISSPGQPAITIDGNTAVPGIGSHADLRNAVTEVTLEYGGGITTLVGPGSVAVPGTLAATEKASKAFGQVDWRTLLQPTIDVTRRGFPFSEACHYYLGYSGEPIFSRSDDGFFALHDNDRQLRPAGTPIVVPHLADTLDAIADDGAALFYHGELGKTVVDYVQAGGGALTQDDLNRYDAIERPCLTRNLRDWQIATNPPPAVGGVTLSAMLSACDDLPVAPWNRDSLSQLIDVQRACLGFRKQRLDLAQNYDDEVQLLLKLAESGDLISRYASGSTVHTSAVDDAGLACAITASSGYGAGDMPPGTGLWLNNCLGEIELNRHGLDATPAGARLPSNMAPSVARSADAVMAIGSPGADRITTALHQFLVNHVQLDMSLKDAVEHPRVHIDTSGQSIRLMAEPGLDLPDLNIDAHTVRQLSMYFGGVGAARYSDVDGFDVAADPRRAGGTFVSA
ncbi:MAG: gamma-glutamyltransferase [Pseudomonadota bacterium]